MAKRVLAHFVDPQMWRWHDYLHSRELYDHQLRKHGMEEIDAWLKERDLQLYRDVTRHKIDGNKVVATAWYVELSEERWIEYCLYWS